MRAHAAAQFTLTHFGAWRWAVRLVAAAAAASVVAWAMSIGSPIGSMVAPAVATALVLLLFAWVAVGRGGAPLVLRWDGRSWIVGAQAGELAVAMDLGVWMLLRFTAADPSARPRGVWVPAQRSGHAAQWHALRCAVYSPRPDAGVDAAPDV